MTEPQNIQIEFPQVFKSPCALDEISKMLSPERLLLYSLVVGIRPRSVLEIGRSHGGSALIIQNALEFNGYGQLVSFDEARHEGPHGIQPDLERELESRGVRFAFGRSPEDLYQARELADEEFDFVLIDGEHQGEQCLDDIEACLPLVSDSAWLVCHDAWFPAVKRSIRIAMERHPIRDCGMLSTMANREFADQECYGEPVVWGGIRLLQLDRNRGA